MAYFVLDLLMTLLVLVAFIVRANSSIRNNNLIAQAMATVTLAIAKIFLVSTDYNDEKSDGRMNNTSHYSNSRRS